MSLPGYREISDALYGSVLIARRDLAGYGFFNNSEAGFWRSFAAIALIAPFYFSYAAIEFDLLRSADGATELAAGQPYYSARAASLLAEWLCFPVLMAVVARALDFQDRYPLYIIAYNWSSLVVIGFLSPPFLLYGFGLMSVRSMVSLSFLLSGCVLYYRWYIARTALELNAVTALGIVLLDLALSLVINLSVDRLIGAG